MSRRFIGGFPGQKQHQNQYQQQQQHQQFDWGSQEQSISDSLSDNFSDTPQGSAANACPTPQGIKARFESMLSSQRHKELLETLEELVGHVKRQATSLTSLSASVSVLADSLNEMRRGGVPARHAVEQPELAVARAPPPPLPVPSPPAAALSINDDETQDNRPIAQEKDSLATSSIDEASDEDDGHTESVPAYLHRKGKRGYAVALWEQTQESDGEGGQAADAYFHSQHTSSSTRSKVNSRVSAAQGQHMGGSTPWISRDDSFDDFAWRGLAPVRANPFKSQQQQQQRK